MLSNEPNVEPGCEYFVYTCSNTARQLFFYPVCSGLFRYEPGYSLARSRYDSFLIMAVTRGSCRVQTGARQYAAGPGDVVLLDCYAPHSYCTDKGWEAIWLHFDGPQSRGYYDYITAQSGHMLRTAAFQDIVRLLNNIFQLFRNGTPISEPRVSRDITDVLTQLALTQAESPNSTASSLGKSIAYLHEHFAEPINLRELAALSSLSPYYFTRLFTRETGLTPHQYLLSVRINSARFLLKSSAMSIKEIGFACGFTSESSFSTTFHKRTGQTPGQYRADL